MPSIRERVSKSGERSWAVLFRHGKAQRSKTFDSLPKAKRFVKLIDALGPERALLEVTAEQRPAGVTLGEIAELFLAWKQGDVTPRTMADYRRGYTNWIAPQFGNREAASIDEGDVQRWVDSMRGKIQPKTIGDQHTLLNQIFNFGKAKSRGLVRHNPCGETSLPKPIKKPPKGLTLVEWRAMRKFAEGYNPDAADLIHFLGAIGWRFSEATALAVRDVEDDGNHVWVDVTRVFRIIDNRQVIVENAAKSWAGFRKSRLPSTAASMVRRRIVGRGPNDFVFTNSRGRHWNQNTFLRNTWPALLKGAEVGSPDRRPTPHWLRHMAVANMARAQVPMHEIQRVIGHESMETTNKVYGGMISTLSSASLVQLDDVLEGRDPESMTVVGEVIELLPELDS